MADKLKVTLVKSTIGAVPKHKKTVEAMGLRKLHKTVELPDNAATRGMIQSGTALGKGRRSLSIKFNSDYNVEGGANHGFIQFKTGRWF